MRPVFLSHHAARMGRVREPFVGTAVLALGGVAILAAIGAATLVAMPLLIAGRMLDRSRSRRTETHA